MMFIAVVIAQVVLWLWPCYYLWQATLHFTRGVMHRAAAFQADAYGRRKSACARVGIKIT